jgi:glycosyltransferase involved in cell wall biosynthesis
MAAGVPVVATSVGGVPDVLQSGRLGLLVEPGSADALADGIQVLLGDALLRAELSARARPLAFSRFGVDRLLADVEALYDELLNSRSMATAGGASA